MEFTAPLASLTGVIKRHKWDHQSHEDVANQFCNRGDIQGFRFSQFDEDAKIAPAVILAMDWLIDDDSEEEEEESEPTPDNPGPVAPPTP